MPCFEWFARQPASYRESVLPAAITARVGVEAAASQGWDRWLGPQGRFIGIDRFGASAPYGELYEQFGITARHVADTALEVMRAERG